MFDVKLVTTDEDRERAFSLRKEVFVKEQGVPLSLELDEHDKTAIHFIVNDGTDTIATARLREIEPKIGKVERVCVLSSFRGKRLGVLIMETVEHYAKEIEFEKLKLNAQLYAVPFYEKLNYMVTSPEFMDAGIPHRAMEKYI
ncbi:GNAT family N-acetyltransferase [Lysinibacillus sp. 2017]|uniref:GNAT family N-acetyltransferase n=1 Tax=unclassified Lysinibacillus TaxID=2636778 RepID=UPI000D52A62B|nr:MULTISPECIES: GNAT family N-acetyltransferase [unclassified Lysinibacillus]AWE06469.1 GNAT family N-acetyltransferase [Lysinibacillus sp. 2017]TGN30602.1 GNAT family N-acetyltransferase [Lysinibacillus sp. S2017]